MATWTDGPEYAPAERPAAFVVPESGPLTAAAPEIAPLGDAPDRAPAEFAAPEARPLEDLEPKVAETRDPHEAFDVASTPMTSMAATPLATRPASQPLGAPAEPAASAPQQWPAPDPGTIAGNPQSAWNSVHASGRPRTPGVDAPPVAAPPPQASNPAPQVNPAPFPQPVNDPWLPPAQMPYGTAPSTPQTVSVGQMWRGATPGLMTTLIIAALINALSLPMLFIAWPLASRTSHRSRTAQRVVRGAIGASLTLGLFGAFTSYAGFDFQSWWEWSGGYAQLAALVLIPVILLVVGSGMRAGEPPAERPGQYRPGSYGGQQAPQQLPWGPGQFPPPPQPGHQQYPPPQPGQQPYPGQYPPPQPGQQPYPPPEAGGYPNDQRGPR